MEDRLRLMCAVNPDRIALEATRVGARTHLRLVGGASITLIDADAAQLREWLGDRVPLTNGRHPSTLVEPSIPFPPPPPDPPRGTPESLDEKAYQAFSETLGRSLGGTKGGTYVVNYVAPGDCEGALQSDNVQRCGEEPEADWRDEHIQDLSDLIDRQNKQIDLLIQAIGKLSGRP